MKARTLPELLVQQAELFPERIAFGEFGGVSVSWERFLLLAQGAASALRGQGVKRSDVVVLMGPNGIAWEAAHFGALFLGVAVAGLDPRQPVEETERTLRQLGASVVVTTAPEVLDRVGPDCRVLTWETLLGSYSGRSALELPRPTDTAALVFSSGTTGAPKAIPYRHDQILEAVEAIARAFPLGPEARLTCWLPLSSLFQRIVDLWGIAAGARSDFVADASRIFEALPVLRPTIFVGVPRFYEKCLEAFPATLTEALGGAVKFAISGSAPLAPSVLAAFRQAGISLLEAYGVSENVIPIALNRPGAERPGSVGRPLFPNEVSLSEEGEVLVRGPGLMERYRSGAAPSLNAEGFYATGDLGRIDADGFLHLEGRKGEKIKTASGRQISPSRVESVYRALPFLKEVFVFGHGRRHIAALLHVEMSRLRPRAGEGRMEALRRQLLEAGRHLAPHERIESFALLNEPFSAARGELTANGKLRRRQIEKNHSALIESLYRARGASSLKVSRRR